MLKELREKQKISLSFVARRLGIDRATMAKIEEGKGYIKLEWVKELAFLYRVPEEELIEKYMEDRKDGSVS